MKKEEYLLNPCKASSLPFWKTNTVKIPDNIVVIPEDDPSFGDVSGEIYFKLMHNLEQIDDVKLPSNFEVVEASILEFVEHINKCYIEEGISEKELESYKLHPVYNPSLWLVIKEAKTGVIVASGIAEFDVEIGEGILEWIEVSPTFRRQKLGKFVVNELIKRLKILGAKFVTVSGKLNNPTNPSELYKSCGFENIFLWKINIKNTKSL